jgi:hypothetical protein
MHAQTAEAYAVMNKVAVMLLVDEVFQLQVTVFCICGVQRSFGGVPVLRHALSVCIGEGSRFL